MPADDILTNAARRCAPHADRLVTSGAGTLGAATASSAIALDKGTGWYTIACSSAFNLLAGPSTVGAPSDYDVYPAGAQEFWFDTSDTKPSANRSTHVRIIMTAGGDYQIHKSSLGKE